MPTDIDEILHLYYRMLLNCKNIKPAEINKIISNENNENYCLDNIEKKIKSLPYFKDDFNVYKKASEKEMDILRKHNIRYVKLFMLNIKSHLPSFIYYYGNTNLDFFNLTGLNQTVKTKKFAFITSSRYKDGKIYRLNEDKIAEIKKIIPENYGFYSGISTEAEKTLMKKDIAQFKNNLILLPTAPLIYYIKDKDFSLYRELPAISAENPLAKKSKYGYAIRNYLALTLTDELIILYLSGKSSLQGVINNFKNCNKMVQIIDNDNDKKEKVYISSSENSNKRPQGSLKTNTLTDIISKKSEFEDNEKSILKYLNNNESIHIDNLINLSNINPKDTLKIISLLEIKGIIKREAGGVIKKL